MNISPPTKQMPFQQWLLYLHPDDRQHVLAAFSSTCDSSDSNVDLRFRMQLHIQDGDLVVDLKGSVVDTGEHPNPIFGIVWDTTSRAQREREHSEALRTLSAMQLKRAEMAENVCVQKQELIDTVCHEIRNPLQGVVGATTLLRDDLSRTKEELIKNVPPKVAVTVAPSSIVDGDLQASGRPLQSAFQHLDTIEECTRQQKHIADEVLDISRLAAGRMELHLEPTDVKQLFATVTTMFASAMQLRRLSVVMHIERLHVWADRQRLLQILGTLLICCDCC